MVKDENPCAAKCKANLASLQKAAKLFDKDVAALKGMLSQYKAKKDLSTEQQASRDILADGLSNFKAIQDEASDMIEVLKQMPDNEDKEAAEPMAVKSTAFVAGFQGYLDAARQVKKECSLK